MGSPTPRINLMQMIMGIGVKRTGEVAKKVGINKEELEEIRGAGTQ